MSSPDVKIPQTNYKKQLKSTLKGIKASAPAFFNLSNQYAPGYTNLNLRTLAQTLFGSPGTPGELGLQSAAYSSSRASDLTDVMNMGPAGYAALMRSNPGLAMSMFNLNNQAGEVFAPGSLMTQLQNTAQDQLALGGSMSQEETDALDQAARSRFAASGIVNTRPAVGMELLNRDSAMQQRLGQRIQYATGIEGLANQGRGFLDQAARTNASIYDPYQAVLGRSVFGGGISPLSLMGTIDTARLFNPSQGQDAFNTNYNAQASAAIANSNNSSATNNALIGGGAALIGGVAIAI
jgi:hypothetical protein